MAAKIGQAKAYRVTAPLIRLKVLTQDGIQVRDFHEGAMVPSETAPDAIRHHLDRGLIEEVKVPAAEAEGTASPEDKAEGAADPDKAGLQGEQKAAQMPGPAPGPQGTTASGAPGKAAGPAAKK